MDLQEIGSYAFILGVIIAVLAGIGGYFFPFGGDLGYWIVIVLVILGIIVGLLNITEKETVTFLVAAIALMATSAIGWQYIPKIGIIIAQILSYIGVFVAPAAVIVALLAIKKVASAK